MDADQASSELRQTRCSSVRFHATITSRQCDQNQLLVSYSLTGLEQAHVMTALIYCFAKLASLKGSCLKGMGDGRGSVGTYACTHAHVDTLVPEVYTSSIVSTWAARYNTWLLI